MGHRGMPCPARSVRQALLPEPEGVVDEGETLCSRVTISGRPLSDHPPKTAISAPSLPHPPPLPGFTLLIVRNII